MSACCDVGGVAVVVGMAVVVGVAVAVDQRCILYSN